MQSPTVTVAEVAAPLAKTSFWFKLLAVVQLSVGALYAVTIFGILIAWLPIWHGILLWQTSSLAEKAHAQNDTQALLEANSKLRTYFMIMGIVTLVGLVLMAIFLVAGGAAMMVALGEAAQKAAQAQ